jgi:hypothetical protein
MKDTVIIGFDEGTYTLSGRNITIAGLSFTLKIEALAYVYNITQNRLYYSPSDGFSNCTVDGTNIVINENYPELGATDKIHIQVYKKTDYLDRATQGVNVLEYEHHEVHAGSHFYNVNFFVLGNNENYDIAFKTADTKKWVHFVENISGTSQTEFRIYEGATVTGGTPLTIFNNDRNSSNISESTLVHTPTVNELGALIYPMSSGLAGNPPSRAQATDGITTRSRELILKQNTTYLIRLTSKQAGNIVGYEMEWYEHTNKI